MTKDDFGVWHVTVPAKDGQAPIAHGSKVKVSAAKQTDGGGGHCWILVRKLKLTGRSCRFRL